MRLCIVLIALIVIEVNRYMNKRQLERMERERLNLMIKNNPRLKAFLDASIEANNPELAEVIQPVIQDMLDKAQSKGIEIGFSAAMIGAYKKIENCNTLEKAVNVLKAEANRIRKKMGLGTVDEMEEEIKSDDNATP